MAKGSWQESLRVAGPHIDLGYRIAGAILIFGGGGAWLDRRLGTEPWISIAGTVLSFIAILGIIMRYSIEADKRKEKEAARDAGRRTASESDSGERGG